MNDAEKTRNMTALQSVQKSTCSKFSVVVRHLVTPSGDLPHLILPKVGIGSVLVIVEPVPVRRHALLDFTYGVLQMSFEGR